MAFEYELVYNNERFYTCLVLLFSIILTSVIITYTLFRVRSKEQRAGSLFLNVIILVYQTSQFLVVVSPPRELYFFVSLQCIGFCILGPAFYLYCRTLLKMGAISLPETIALYSVSCLGILTVLTNGFHEMFFRIYDMFYIDYGIMYFMALISNSLWAMAGSSLLMKYRVTHEEYNIQQRFLYPICLLAVIGAGVFDGINPELFSYGLTPSSLSIIQILFLFSNRLLGLSGNLFIGKSNILDCINESVIMTDTEGNIIFYNDTQLNRQIGMENGADIQEILDKLTHKYEYSDGLDTLYDYLNLYKTQHNTHKDTAAGTIPNSICGEITIESSGKRWYFYTVQPITKGKIHVAGVLYVFRDVTEDKVLINHLNDRNSKLADTYEKMKKYSAIIRQLSVERERNKILKKISRDIEESVLKIISLLNEIEAMDDKDARSVEISLHKSIAIARNGIAGIRKSISAISEPIMQEGEK